MDFTAGAGEAHQLVPPRAGWLTGALPAKGTPMALSESAEWTTEGPLQRLRRVDVADAAAAPDEVASRGYEQADLAEDERSRAPARIDPLLRGGSIRLRHHPRPPHLGRARSGHGEVAA